MCDDICADVDCTNGAMMMVKITINNERHHDNDNDETGDDNHGEQHS